MRWKQQLAHGCMALTLTAVLTGCMSTNHNPSGNNHSSAQLKKNTPERMRLLQAEPEQQINMQQMSDAVIPMLDQGGQFYVPLSDLAATLSFQSEWDKQASSFRIGDNDVVYEIMTESNAALKAGEAIRLSQPSIVVQGVAYIPYESLDALFGDAMNYEKQGSNLLIKPAVAENLTDDAGVPDFADDPTDSSTPEKVSMSSTRPVMMLAENQVNMDKLLDTAEKYIGVGYDFGAKPYPKSGKFDCSTFTKYVYGKHGIELPRLSRQQGKVGRPVSRTSLRKGDLLFFYLPGRYKSNEIIGHVGIYMGGGRMIHASNKPKDGVQITSINKSFWKKTYLSARRVD
jgi:cell wall-associated NlpC family hydrolase